MYQARGMFSIHEWQPKPPIQQKKVWSNPFSPQGHELRPNIRIDVFWGQLATQTMGEKEFSSLLAIFA